MKILNWLHKWGDEIDKPNPSFSFWTTILVILGVILMLGAVAGLALLARWLGLDFFHVILIMLVIGLMWERSELREKLN